MTKKVLFQTSFAPETSIPDIIEKSKLVLDAPFTNTNDKTPSPKSSYTPLVNEFPVNNNISILMYLIALDNIQSQSKPHQSPHLL